MGGIEGVLTLSCPSESCPMCMGDHCNACEILRRQGGTPAGYCSHGSVERHVAMSPALDDETVLEIPPINPSLGRVSTRPLPPIMTERIEIEFSDEESVARFLELVARVARAKRRLIITVE